MTGAIETGLGLGCCADQLLNDKPFPAISRHGVAQNGIQVLQAQQSMNDAAVAHVHLGCTDQTFTDISTPCGQAAHQHQVAEQIDIPTDGLSADGQGSCQFRLVKQLPLVMGQHGPQAPQCGRRNPRAQHWNIFFQISGDERFSPTETLNIIGRHPRQRKPTPNPQGIDAVGALVGKQYFSGLKRCEFQLCDPPGQTFTALLEQYA